ncbi:MAG: indole-3-glycerol phosphate synthase TrpC [Candidatus Poribacteria bacterium]|nr:indole-3-glycerol phosphate synthase TrpC [Candidatus Poribacteria bacterium]
MELQKGKPLILDTIVAHKRKEFQRDQEQVPLSTLKAEAANLPPTRDFQSALSTPNHVDLIAEVKKKSPSKGLIRANFDPVEIAQTYAINGASAISVLTDREFFAGDLAYLSAIREAVDLPLLRKDFTIHPYHIYQARVAGADAILLIVAILTLDQIREFIDIAKSLGLASLVEVHTGTELECALAAGAEIIGINNRNLKTFDTDIATTFRLRESIPNDKIVVSESGIYTRDDVVKLQAIGINAILVGESLMRSPDIGRKVRELLA